MSARASAAKQAEQAPDFIGRWRLLQVGDNLRCDAACLQQGKVSRLFEQRGLW
jgi:hypothetical protein